LTTAGKPEKKQLTQWWATQQCWTVKREQPIAV